MKRAVAIFFSLTLMLSLDSQAFAYTPNYSSWFEEYYYTSSVATARSPFHVGDTDTGADDFALPTHRVNGPNNQPRQVCSTCTPDLHDGTDLKAAADVPVYPMFKSIVRKVYQQSSTNNNGYVIVQYDIDNNGTWDNYYAKYIHIVPTSGLVENSTTLAPTQKIGLIDIKKKYWPHLHLQDTNSTGTSAGNSKKLFRFFRSVQSWGYGYYLDYFAGDAMVGNTLYISVNSIDDGTNAAPARIEFFYKIGSGTWQQGASTTTPFLTGNSTGDYYRYALDLKTLSGAGTGQTIYYYLAAIRTNGTVSSDYNWGLWPQYYKMPDRTPSQISGSGNTIISKSFTIQ